MTGHVRALHNFLTCLAVLGCTANIARAGAPTIIVVELFTSEGCSSCPPADTLLQRLVDAPPVAGVEVIALGEHVDYWDQQGWKDRFSSAQLTNRQRGYSQALNTENIYTPQMVVDGRAEFVGSDAAAARRAIERAATAPRGTVQMAIATLGTFSSSIRVTVTALDVPAAGPGDRGEIVVAVTESHLTSNVKRGENRGRMLAHTAVVRTLRAIGEANGRTVRCEIAIDPAWNRDHITLVAFVQESRSRRIVAAASMPLRGAAALPN
jgi:hypothetical protein